MNEKREYKIKGTVTSKSGGCGVPNLNVEAWDKDLVIDDLLGSAKTDENGSFTLNFKKTYYKEICFDRKPDIYFKVFHRGKLIKSTEDAVLWNVKSGEVVINIPVTIEFPQEQYVVKGKVTDKANNELFDLQVQAVRRYLRKEEMLGGAQTNEHGEYHIAFYVPDGTKKGLNIALEISDREGSLLHRTKTRHDVPKEVEINVHLETVFPGFSEFERITRALQPLLEKGLTFADLEQDDEHDDISYLSGETRIKKNKLACFVLAQKLGMLGIQPEFWFALLKGSFFKYEENESLQHQLATILKSVSSLDALAVRKSLARSFNLGEIPEALHKKLDEWIKAVLKFAASYSVSGGNKPMFVKQALDHAGIKETTKQEKFARLFNEYKAFTPELLKTLEEDESFEKSEIADLNTSYTLSEMTQGDFSVVKVIKDEFEIRQPEKIRTLAKKSEGEWVNLIKEKYAAGEIKLPFEVSKLSGKIKFPEAEAYGKTLERQFREAFPTTAFAGGLERALRNGGAKGMRHAETLKDFLDVHGDFEFLNTPIEDYLKNSIHPDFEAIAKDENFQLEVKAVQRVFKLAPTFGAADTLLAEGVHSAQQVYRMGETEFVKRFAGRAGFDAKSARLAWNRAADTHAAVLTLVGDLKSLETDTLPQALKNSSEALSTFPNWNNLFKTGDLCECEHCRSVLSPAAYFADLLMFLKDRNSKKPEPGGNFYSVKDILFGRRPDLGFLELNCENALTPLPYIDVVCEVLEGAVDKENENDLILSDFDTIPDDPEAAKTAVIQAFEVAFADPVNDGKEKIDVGADVSLSQVDPSNPDQWVVHGDNATYLLKKKAPAPNFFAEILRNTKVNADELRAFPQSVNPKAYEKLKVAKFPFAVPFDLFAEEVRSAFRKCNLQRWDLMQTLRGNADPNNPGDSDIAAEYFGINADRNADFDEKRLILEADPTETGQQERWGEDGVGWPDAIAAIANVKNFIVKTGLDYTELLALLDLKFINPDGDIAIKHQDPSCDTDKKSIQGLDAIKLDRIHRFLRLWRKLRDLKMWELDLVICHPAIGNGNLDEPFLVHLFYFDRLKRRLGKKVTIEQVCALFGNLNFETRFTRLHKKREGTLYQSLFLNRRLIQPLDPAFKINPGTDDLPAGETLTDANHLPVVLSALDIHESDLNILLGLTKSSDSAPYITDSLNLSNLSFLWRHSWLAKVFKYKVEDWKIVLKLFQQDIFHFASPQAAWGFFESVDHLKATGFIPDELNWLLTADDSAKGAIKEPDAARFLAALRKELQAIREEYAPAQYDFLSITPPTGVDKLTALLTSLLQKLNRNEAETRFFIATLRDELKQEKIVPGLPEGFVFPESITGEPHNVSIHYAPLLSFSGRMTDEQRATLQTHVSLSVVIGLDAYRDAIDELFEKPGRPVEVHLPAGFTFPESITGAPNHIPIRYSPMVRFKGLMTVVEKDTLLDNSSLSAVTSVVAYREAINEFFDSPRLALKFFEPVFTEPLANLPAVVDFKAQLPTDLAAKIAYDAEQKLLRFTGIMINAELEAILALSGDPNYSTAVNSLYTQPKLVASPDECIWLLDSDLRFPLRDLDNPADDNLAENIATATGRALSYLSKTLSEKTIVQQSAVQLGLTESITHYLLTDYSLLPNTDEPSVFETLMAHLSGTFTPTSGVVDYATLKTTFDGWFWVNRVAAILNKWKITLAELKKINVVITSAKLIDFLNLPLDHTGAIPSIDHFLRTCRLLRLRDRVPETRISLLEILEKLNNTVYSTAAANPPTAEELFAVDVEGMNKAWLAADVETLTASLDLTFPDAYLLPESWERLQRAFYFLKNLNAGAHTVRIFAAAAMNYGHAKAVKELLRSKFGTDSWLILSAEIQDILRERKRDALAAYLLTQSKADDAPSGKWENMNDLYAYYLLDIEMSSCQLTSRLVQGSGSVQLFVQRCFMGLEPDVVVKADGDGGDSAWRWWKWMRKYRVWEANRKVFLWPENWIEPELKTDRSPFFKDLENELLQNEINQHNVETAFLNYLEKLDGVAQLEIAGFYQEDDGDNAIIHVFGRTTSAEPHLYFYRRYDYRQWSPWEKVELDIQGDYLIPAVVNKRLFLFWPVFTEVPDEDENRKARVPAEGDTEFEPELASKKLRLQMAMSEYRQGKWTPKKISKDFHESGSYKCEIVRKHYRFFPIDRSETDGRFGIKYDGYSLARGGSKPANLVGSFEISGCTGVPEKTNFRGNFEHAFRPEGNSTGNDTEFHKWVELGTPNEFGELQVRHDDGQQDFTIDSFYFAGSYTNHKPVLMQTPGFFNISPPWHLSYLDKIWFDGCIGMMNTGFNERYCKPLVGNGLPFFFNDERRTFFVLPSLMGNLLYPLPSQNEEEGETSHINESTRKYYPEVKGYFQKWDIYFWSELEESISELDLTTLSPTERRESERLLFQQFSEVPSPPYTDKQIKDLATRFYMRFKRFYTGFRFQRIFQFCQFNFKNFYHPFVCDFAKLVYNPLKGIPALMSREIQLKNTGFSFGQSYQPTEAVVKLPPQYPSQPDCYPREVVDFTPDGAYSSYNWELFFHAPLLIANALSKNQRFEEAREWYHFIFNPLGVENSLDGGSPVSKYWITKPFFETTDPQYMQQRIDNVLLMLAGDTNVPGYSEQSKKDLEDQVLDWRTNPFEPHRIANYRTVAYQKTVVMKYLDNLIAWGDYLFRQDSMESINEATQLYILAGEILGTRPKKIPSQQKPPIESFNELEPEFDEFSNALVDVENLVPYLPGYEIESEEVAPLPMLYFCVPQNDKMLSYWDIVADRLYKIRHCMNIEGVVRQLALFEPPIDPGALVKAVAGGVDISNALADLNAPLPLYRFNVLLQKANEVCNDVKALGSALLSALEKKDSEALGLLRQSHEIRLLEAVKIIREKQIVEAKENLEGAKKSKELAETKKKYYVSREFMSAGEMAAISLSGVSLGIHTAGSAMDFLGAVLAAIPDFDVGASGIGGSPTVKVKTGGVSFSKAVELAARAMYSTSTILDKTSSIVATKASYQRRKDDWDFQRDLAEKEIEQIEKSINAAELRVAFAEKELDNHVLQIENAKATDEFMRSKYTNKELYQWQVGQISDVYFQSYKLAYDLAKRAERCFRFELGLQDSSYIKFGYWDSLKKGLLSGEKLQYDLRRLESAYLDQNRREFELTKHISLALLDPLALIKLRETGQCFFTLKEEIFDLDFPGHYFRRIKSVSLTLPCVVGPYTSVSCTLRLLKNTIRMNTASGDNGYPRNIDDQSLPASDDRFTENNIPVKAIAASNSQNDSGVFEMSFRDERYLPFEGAGAISEWSLELFSDLPANNPDPGNPDFGKPLRQFNYSAISDAILHVKYTAREDAGVFKNGVIGHLRDYFSQDVPKHSLRMFNLRQEFPSQWHSFLHPDNSEDGNVFELEMSTGLFPLLHQGKTLNINTIWLMARCSDPGSYNVVMVPPLPASPPAPAGSNTMTLAPVGQYGGLHFKEKSVDDIKVMPTEPPVKWHLKMTRPDDENLQENEIEDVLLVLGYNWE